MNLKHLACAVATAACAAAVPAQPASADMLLLCDWHGYSLSADTSGELTAVSQAGFPLTCAFYQYRPTRTFIGSRSASGSPAWLAVQVGFNASYVTEVCTYENGVLVECHRIW